MSSKTISSPVEPEPIEIFEGMGSFEIADAEKCFMSVRLQFPKFAHGFKPSDFEGFIKLNVGEENVVSLGRLSFPNEWQMLLSSKESRENLIRMGRTRVNGRTCWIHPLSHSEVRGYIHWIPNEIPDERIKEKLRTFGDVLFMEAQTQPKWDLKIKSDSRYFALYLKPGTAVDDIPHFMTVCGYMGLITIKGRSPACFHCREIGHRKTECKKYRERLSEYCMRKPRDPPVPRKRGRRHDGSAQCDEGNSFKRVKQEEMSPKKMSNVRESDASNVKVKKLEDGCCINEGNASVSNQIDLVSCGEPNSDGVKRKKRKKKKKNKKSSESEALNNLPATRECDFNSINMDSLNEIDKNEGKVVSADLLVPDNIVKREHVSQSVNAVQSPFQEIPVSSSTVPYFWKKSGFAAKTDKKHSGLAQDLNALSSDNDTRISIHNSNITVIKELLAENLPTVDAGVDPWNTLPEPVDFPLSSYYSDQTAISEVLNVKDANSNVVSIPSLESQVLKGDVTIKNVATSKEGPTTGSDLEKLSINSELDISNEASSCKRNSKTEIGSKNVACTNESIDNQLNVVKKTLSFTSDIECNNSCHSVSKLSETLKNVKIQESAGIKIEDEKLENQADVKSKKVKRRKKRKN